MKEAKKSKEAKEDLIREILESNIGLQNKHADLMLELSKLSKHVENLLDLFEGAATAIKKGEDREPLAERLDKLLEQNKNIANGLFLLEKYIRERKGPEPLSFSR